VELVLQAKVGEPAWHTRVADPVLVHVGSPVRAIAGHATVVTAVAVLAVLALLELASLLLQQLLLHERLSSSAKPLSGGSFGYQLRLWLAFNRRSKGVYGFRGVYGFKRFVRLCLRRAFDPAFDVMSGI
jgi:hypothetical protein